MERKRELITMDELSQYTGIGRSTLEAYVQHGNMPYILATKKKKLFVLAEVMEWMVRNKGKGEWSTFKSEDL